MIYTFDTLSAYPEFEEAAMISLTVNIMAKTMERVKSTPYSQAPRLASYVIGVKNVQLDVEQARRG